jgi:cytochrome c553
MLRNNTRLFSGFLLLCLTFLSSACGTVATSPELLMTNTPEDIAEENGGVVAVVPTATSTPLPEPTLTSTTAPTDTPELTAEITDEPTAEVTDEPTTGVAEAGVSPTPDQFTILAQFGNPANGEALFMQEFETNQGPYACFTCHNVESEQTKIGPGQYNIRDRAAQRVPGQSAAQYIYTSITEPQEYIVPGFENVPIPMPSNYSELLSDTQIYDLAAYLLTLHD